MFGVMKYNNLQNYKLKETKMSKEEKKQPSEIEQTMEKFDKFLRKYYKGSRISAYKPLTSYAFEIHINYIKLFVKLFKMKHGLESLSYNFIVAASKDNAEHLYGFKREDFFKLYVNKPDIKKFIRRLLAYTKKTKGDKE